MTTAMSNSEERAPGLLLGVLFWQPAPYRSKLWGNVG
jgi:hypothetical protein